MSDQNAGHASYDPSDSGSSIATLTAPTKRITPKNKPPKPLPPYKVLLHNDDVNSFDHVIMAILKLTSLQTQDAVLRTLEAHESGISLLLTTHRERAELYVEQFATMTIIAPSNKRSKFRIWVPVFVGCHAQA